MEPLKSGVWSSVSWFSAPFFSSSSILLSLSSPMTFLSFFLFPPLRLPPPTRDRPFLDPQSSWNTMSTVRSNLPVPWSLVSSLQACEPFWNCFSVNHMFLAFEPCLTMPFWCCFDPENRNNVLSWLVMVEEVEKRRLFVYKHIIFCHRHLRKKEHVLGTLCRSTFPFSPSKPFSSRPS